MKNLMRVLAASAILSSSAFASTNTWRMCDNCSSSQKAQCAIQTATVDNLKTGDYVWIVDFSNETVSKYYMQVTPPGTIIQGEEESPRGAHLEGATIFPFLETMSSHEVEVWGAVIGIVQDIYRPQGFGYDYPSCGGGNLTSTADGGLEGPGQYEIQSQPYISYNVTVPGGQDMNSAYDVIGRNSIALQLGQQHSGVLGMIGATQTFFTNWLLISPIDSTTSLLLTFSDGSSGIWRFNFERDRWEADWSTFEDSDGNPIPHTSADLAAGMGLDFSGTAQGQQNLQNFLTRAGMFGIPITGPGGGGPLPTRCEITNDGLECWPVIGN